MDIVSIKNINKQDLMTVAHQINNIEMGDILNPEEIEQLWSCPNCGSQMKKLDETATPCRVCISCGCSIDGEDKTFNPGVLCPNCNQEIGEKSECPYCGYDLGSDFD